MDAIPVTEFPGTQPKAGGYESGRLELARLTLGDRLTLQEGVNHVAAIASEAIGVKRVSVWVFNEDHTSIRCDHLFQIGQNASGGVRFHADDFPEYFKALAQHRVVAVVDVEGDPYTVEFREPYFQPLGITSMLDAPVFRGGKCMGILCHEHIGPVRQWSEADHDFAGTAADALARLYEEAARRDAEGQLVALQGRVGDLERMGALGRLAAGIAHDFRNVLASAMSYGELLEHDVGETGDRAAAKAHVKGLQTALEQGLKLSEDLLDFGLGRKNKPRVVKVGEHIHAFKPMLAMAIGPKVNLAMHCDANDERAFIDTAQWDRAILNLAFNARDAMPEGGTLYVTVKKVRHGRAKDSRANGSESEMLMVELRDTGVGVDADTQSRMFEPYFTTKEKKGTGLGLAFVKQVITHAGGDIEVESEPGKGLAVRLFLPVIG
jgi:two-component system, cell cycle sensor histidine kinase and response regulator CckA